MAIQKHTFEWTAAREQAARLLAEGELADAEIARRVGFKRDALAVWKRNPVFAARIQAIIAELAEVARTRSIGRREDRVEAYQQRWALLKQIMAERAADPAMQAIPGGKTGLMVIKESEGVAVKDPANPNGPEKAVAVPTEVAVDTGLLKELREHEKQAAQELGQWTEKRQLVGADGGDLRIRFIEVEKADDRPAHD